MTIQEIRFLKMVHKLTDCTERVFYYDKYDASLHLYSDSDVSYPCGKLSNEINSILNSLLNNECISLLPPSGMDGNCYQLTHKGLHFFQFSLSQFVSFLFKSIIVPIAVAFITALLVSA
mgnify:CR=1 FL=1